MTERQPPAETQKRTRHDASSNEKSIETLKITGLNYDCLEKIFDRLDFDAFFNTALSNKSLQMAAVSAFNRKFGVKTIILYPKKVRDTFLKDSVIRVRGLKSCLQFVRCFGETITNLNVLKKNSDSNANDYLNQYIQQYCAGTLNKISLVRGLIHCNSFQQPFSKVDVVETSDFEALPRFVDWFPNMRSLHFKMNYFSNDDEPAIHFPQLQHLTFELIMKHPSMNNRYGNLLRANPQLQSIELVNKKMLMARSLHMIRFNGSISKLKINHPGLGENIHTKDAKRLAHEHPLLVEVDLPWYHFNVNAAMTLIRQLNALKMFRFAVNNQTECDDIVKQLDGEWHHDIRPAQYSRFDRVTYMILELSR